MESADVPDAPQGWSLVLCAYKQQFVHFVCLFTGLAAAGPFLRFPTNQKLGVQRILVQKKASGLHTSSASASLGDVAMNTGVCTSLLFFVTRMYPFLFL